VQEERLLRWLATSCRGCGAAATARTRTFDASCAACRERRPEEGSCGPPRDASACTRIGAGFEFIADGSFASGFRDFESAKKIA